MFAQANNNSSQQQTAAMGAKRSSRVPRVFKKPSTHREQSGLSSPKSEIQGAICLRDRVTKRSKTPTRQPRAAKENTCEMVGTVDPSTTVYGHTARHSQEWQANSAFAECAADFDYLVSLFQERVTLLNRSINFRKASTAISVI